MWAGSDSARCADLELVNAHKHKQNRYIICRFYKSQRVANGKSFASTPERKKHIVIILGEGRGLLSVASPRLLIDAENGYALLLTGENRFSVYGK